MPCRGWTTVVVLCAVAVPSARTQTEPDAQATDQPLTLEIRVFDGTDEVTSQTRVRVFKAGSRTDPQTLRATSGAATAQVPVGFYDLQVVREREGAVAGIRWAEQRLVQRYPDAHGRHLEAVNLQPGYGALQIRHQPSPASDEITWRATIYRTGDATKEAGKSVKGDGYLLFVVPAGQHDVQILPAIGEPIWIRNIELPADQTRLQTWKG